MGGILGFSLFIHYWVIFNITSDTEILETESLKHGESCIVGVKIASDQVNK